MKDHELILQMIERVDPEDMAKLDEIDARAECYLNTTYQQEFIRMINRCGRYGDGFSFYYKYRNGEQGTSSHNLTVRYTRSRDALKSIRPEGWWFRMGTDKNQEHMGGLYNGKIKNEGFATDELPLPTEELAELHAIIQAIAYERGIK